MYQNLELFRLSSAMAKHAVHRQTLSAQNMAHSDTPGYRARDLAAFRDHVEPARHSTEPRATRSTHLHGRSALGEFEPKLDNSAIGEPNRNSVSLETEMVRAVEIRRQHDRAIAIYKSSLQLIRSSLGRR